MLKTKKNNIFIICLFYIFFEFFFLYLNILSIQLQIFFFESIKPAFTKAFLVVRLYVKIKSAFEGSNFFALLEKPLHEQV